jgi:hypothetical protein
MISNFNYILVSICHTPSLIFQTCLSQRVRNLIIKIIYRISNINCCPWIIIRSLILRQLLSNLLACIKSIQTILRFLINPQNLLLQINTCLNKHSKCIISILHFLSIFFPKLLKLFLAFKISRIALFHILIYSFQSLFILLHTLR